METYLLFLRYQPDLPQWLYSTNLVICMHDRYKNGFPCYSPFHIIRVNQTVSCYRQICNLPTFPFKIPAWLQHGIMFNCCSDYMSSLVTVGIGCSKNSKIIRLSPATYKDNFIIF